MRYPKLLLSLLMLTACEQTSPLMTSAAENIVKPVAVQSIDINPCEIILTPVEGVEHDSLIWRYQKAITNHSQILVNLEKLGWAYVSEARKSFDNGYFKLARHTAGCIAQKQQNSSPALLLKAHVLHQLHQFNASEKVAKKLVDQRGLWFDYAVLGDTLMEQGRLKEAADAYQIMMDQRPGPQAYNRAAHLRWMKGDLPGAIEIMQLSVRGSSPRAVESTAWTQTRLALYLFQAGRVDAAQAVIDHIFLSIKDYAPALLLQGRIHLAQNKADDAVAVLTRAAQLNPQPEYQWLLLEALQLNQQTERARVIETRLNNSAEVEDPRTYALYLATVRQQLQTSLMLAKQGLETRQDVFSLDAMAWSLFAAHRIPEALSFIQDALSQGTQDARLFYHSAVIHQAAGRNPEALSWFNKATEIQHMLLPSERQELETKFAVNPLQCSVLENPLTASRNTIF